MIIKNTIDLVFEDKQLLRDFEKIGMKERMYNEEMITDAWESVDIDNYFNISLDRESVTYRTTIEDTVKIFPFYEGTIIGTFDIDSIWEEFSESLKSLNFDNYDTVGYETSDFHSLKEIQDSFDLIKWDDEAERLISEQEAYDFVEWDFKTVENKEYIYIEASPKIDSDLVDCEPDVLLSELLGNL